MEKVITIASMSNNPADVLAALYRGMGKPHGKTRRESIRKKIRAAQSVGQNWIEANSKDSSDNIVRRVRVSW